MHTLKAFGLPMPKTSWRFLGLSHSDLSARGELSLSDATFVTRSFIEFSPALLDRSVKMVGAYDKRLVWVLLRATNNLL